MRFFVTIVIIALLFFGFMTVMYQRDFGSMKDIELKREPLTHLRSNINLPDNTAIDITQIDIDFDTGMIELYMNIKIDETFYYVELDLPLGEEAISK